MIPLFIISPFFALIVSFNKVNINKYLPNVLWFFIAFYCSNIDLVRLGKDPDISRYCAHYFKGFDFIEFEWTYFYTSTVFDLINPFFQFVAAKLSSNYRVLLLFYGLYFGYFYSRNFVYFYNLINSNNKISSIMRQILVMVLLMILPFYDVNGFRFWSAMQIIVFAIFVVKQRELPLLILAAITHFSFWMVVILYVLFKISQSFVNLYKVWYVLLKVAVVLYILNLFIPQNIFVRVDVSSFSFLGENLSERISAYTDKSDETIEAQVEFDNSKHGYVNWPIEFVGRVVLIIGLIILWGGKQFSQFRDESNQQESFAMFLSVIFLFIGLLQPFRFVVFGFFTLMILIIKYLHVEKIFLSVDRMLYFNGLIALVVYFRYVGEFSGFRMLIGGILPSLVSSGDIRIIDVAKIFIPSL